MLPLKHIIESIKAIMKSGMYYKINAAHKCRGAASMQIPMLQIKNIRSHFDTILTHLVLGRTSWIMLYHVEQTKI